MVDHLGDRHVRPFDTLLDPDLMGPDRLLSVAESACARHARLYSRVRQTPATAGLFGFA